MLKTLAVVFLLFCLPQLTFSQNSKDSLPAHKMLFLPPPILHLNVPVRVVAKDFSTKNLPFFCDKEIKLEKTTKIPLRFRLGSVEYTDHLEGKDR